MDRLFKMVKLSKVKEIKDLETKVIKQFLAKETDLVWIKMVKLNLVLERLEMESIGMIRLDLIEAIMVQEFLWMVRT